MRIKQTRDEKDTIHKLGSAVQNANTLATAMQRGRIFVVGAAVSAPSATGDMLWLQANANGPTLREALKRLLDAIDTWKVLDKMEIKEAENVVVEQKLM